MELEARGWRSQYPSCSCVDGVLGRSKGKVENTIIDFYTTLVKITIEEQPTLKRSLVGHAALMTLPCWGLSSLQAFPNAVEPR